MRKFNNYTIVCISAVSLLGIFALIFATNKCGLGVSIGSTNYIQAARHLIKGFGLSVIRYDCCENQLMPMTHYPPLYPILLSMSGIFGVDILTIARWLNIFLFGSNILLTGFIVSKYTQSAWISILASYLIFAYVQMLIYHSYALTEPFFIFFMLLGLFLLAFYIENPKRSLLIASSGAIALAFLARYAGVTLVATGMTGILFLNRQRFYKKIVDSLIFFAISSLPMIIWMMRNFYFIRKITDRNVTFHPVNGYNLKSGLDTILEWFLPFGWHSLKRIEDITIFIFSLVITLGILFIIIVYFRHSKNRGISRVIISKQPLMKMPGLMGVFFLVYAVFLIIANSFFDASARFVGRIFLPLYISALILFLCVVYKLFRSEGNKSIRRMIILTCVGFAMIYSLSAIKCIVYIHENGLGYTSKILSESQIIRQVRVLPPGIKIYCNAPEVIYFLADRIALRFPLKRYPYNLKINDKYLYEVAKMEEDLKQKGAVFVFLDKINRRLVCSKQELEKRISTYLVTAVSDGAIYGVYQNY